MVDCPVYPATSHSPLVNLYDILAALGLESATIFVEGRGMSTPKKLYQFLLRKLPVFGWLLGFLALFFGYLYSSQLVVKNSDDASIILEGQAMLHGNLLMHGWYLPSDSFITTEMPLDAINSIFFTGVQILRITPALLYAATVLTATYLATRQVSDPPRRWLAAAACLALIAFPVGLLFSLVMQGPMHIGTILASLIAWVAYDHFVKHSKQPASSLTLGLFIIVTILAIIGDPMAELLIVVPVTIVSGLMLWRTRGRSETARATLGSALLALLVGIGARQALIASGTFVSTAELALTPPGNITYNLLWFLLGIFQAFHIELQPSKALDVSNIQLLPGLPLGQLVLFTLLNVGFLVVCTIGFARLFRRSLIPKDMEQSLTSVLTWAILADVLAYLCTDFSLNITGLRYLIPAGIYAGILSYPAIARAIPKRHVIQVVLAFLIVSGLTYAVVLAQAPRTQAPESQLITFLEGHNLTYGFGTYWAANITTLTSNERVQVVPVTEQYGSIYRFIWHSNSAWFEGPQLGSARFVVIDESVSAVCFQRAIVKSFGEPDHIYYLDSSPKFVIFAWNHPIVGSSVASTSAAYAMSYCHSQ